MQLTFGDAEALGQRKKTRRELFLNEIDRVVLWKRLLALIEPHSPLTGRRARQAVHPLIGVGLAQLEHLAGREFLVDLAGAHLKELSPLDATAHVLSERHRQAVRHARQGTTAFHVGHPESGVVQSQLRKRLTTEQPMRAVGTNQHVSLKGQAAVQVAASPDDAMAMLLASETPAMEAYRFSRAVNTPRNNTQQLLLQVA